MEALLSSAVILAVSFTPFVMVIVELIKQAHIVDKKWLPHISVGIGFLLGVAFSFILKEDLVLYAVSGFLSGASASGLYDLFEKKPSTGNKG